MPTVTSTGASCNPNTIPAAEEAVKEAMAGLSGRQPICGFVFASSKHNLGVALSTAGEVAKGADLLGCSTAGEFTERGLTKGGLAIFLIASDELVHDIAVAHSIKAGYGSAAQSLCHRFAETNRAAVARGFSQSTTVTLIDGLCGVGEKLIRDILGGTRPFQQVVGGAAGDDGAFAATFVGAQKSAASDSAAALHVFGPKNWGMGVDHGLRPTTDKMVVSKASGNVVYELDGKPAFDIYKQYARERGVKLEKETAGRFLIGNELGVYFLDQLRHARAPIGVGSDGSLTLAAEIAPGSSVCILDGERSSMVAAARRAAHEAFGHLQGNEPAGILLFDCVCRGMILENEFQSEIDAIRSVFPDVPLAGFLTYGEIARFKGRLDGWHNTTAVVAAIPA